MQKVSERCSSDDRRQNYMLMVHDWPLSSIKKKNCVVKATNGHNLTNMRIILITTYRIIRPD